MPVAEELRPTLSIVSFQVLETAILGMLSHAAERNTFTSLNCPAWDGWVSARWIRWRLPLEIRNGIFEGWSDQPRDREAYYAVESVMLALSHQRKLERRRVTVIQSNRTEDEQEITEWQFRLPGDCGCCFWDPMSCDGPYPGETQQEYDALMARAMESRQVRALACQLAKMGCQIPPYIVAKVERTIRTPSSAARYNRIAW